MSNDTEALHQLIINHLEKSDRNQGAIFKKLDDQGTTLNRLTTTVELHQKYSENLEKEQKLQRVAIIDIEDEVVGLQDHVKEVKIWMKILKPTKVKIMVIAVIGSLFGGNEAIKVPVIRELIKSNFFIDINPKTQPAPKPSDDGPVAP